MSGRLLPWSWVAVLACTLSGVAGSAGGAEPAEAPAPQVRPDALARLNVATLGLRATAVDGAASIATLGRERQGSGVLIDADGLVLTIGYLVLEADRVDLVVDGERTVPARVVGYDLATGFGLVQALTPVRVAPAVLGSASGLADGDPLVIASGGARGELSLAHLVSRRAFSGYWEYHIEGALFTVPPRIDHSGAGLFSTDGELLGIGSLVVGEALGEGKGRLPGNMFVPVDLLKPILAEMRERGASRHSTRAWLGVNCAEHAGAVIVVRVAPDGPAERAGVQPGDRILRIDGAEVGALEPFYKALWRDGTDRDVELVVRRGEETLTLHAHTRDRATTLRKPTGI